MKEIAANWTLEMHGVKAELDSFLKKFFIRINLLYRDDSF
jgi:hypothetical protein